MCLQVPSFQCKTALNCLIQVCIWTMFHTVKTHSQLQFTGGCLCLPRVLRAQKRASASSIALIAGLLTRVLAAFSWISMLVTALHICAVLIFGLYLVDLCHFRCWKLAGAALQEKYSVIIWGEGWLTLPGNETTERRRRRRGERRSDSSGRTASLHSLTDTFSPSSPSLLHLKWPVVSMSWNSVNEKVQYIY